MMRIRPIWFDSMGAKSASVFVSTKDVNILIDPGAAALQPGFPLPDSVKYYYYEQAMNNIIRYLEKADVVIITHYHYDHHVLPSWFLPKKIFHGKLILAKNPNFYINRSQHERARLFFRDLINSHTNNSFEDFVKPPKEVSFEDPMESLPIARSKDFGDYNTRRKYLLEKGRKWFMNMVNLWTSSPWINEFSMHTLHVEFADGKSYSFGNTKISFTKPMFHGIEFDRLGWVIGLTISYAGNKLLYSSDIQGPFIEDYARWIIDEDPDYIFLDGPQTYQLGYLLNRTNLKRAIENAKSILSETQPKWIVYDHHLLRDIRWRDRVREVLKLAEKLGRNLITAANMRKLTPVADVVHELIFGAGLNENELSRKFHVPKSLNKELILFFSERRKKGSKNRKK